MATNENILKGLAMLYTVYSHEREKSTMDGMKMRAELWLELFGDMDDAVYAASIKQHITESKWFPQPSELFSISKKWEDIADGGDDWAAAWSAIKAAISRYGAWGTTDEVALYIGEKLPSSMADDTRMIIQRFGWRELCGMEIDQESTWRAQFRDAYTRVRTSRMERHRMPQDVQAIIGGIAQRLSANRKGLQAPKNDEEGV